MTRAEEPVQKRQHNPDSTTEEYFRDLPRQTNDDYMWELYLCFVVLVFGSFIGTSVSRSESDREMESFQLQRLSVAAR